MDYKFIFEWLFNIFAVVVLFGFACGLFGLFLFAILGNHWVLLGMLVFAILAFLAMPKKWSY